MSENQEFPSVLFFCDFPPSNDGGGSILLSRLLSSYPVDRIAVLTSKRAFNLSTPAGKLNCQHVLFPRTNRVGRLGLGRLKELLDWVLFPALIVVALWQVYRRRVDVMLTIAHGDFVLATAIVSWLTSIPFVMFVHDDWMDNISRSPSFLRYCRPKSIFKIICHRARRIYAVSPQMRAMLKAECDVDAVLQMSAAHSVHQTAESKSSDSKETIRIVYAGNGYGMDCLSLLVEIVKGEKLRQLTGKTLELHLYLPVTQDELRERCWQDPRVVSHGWVASETLPAVYASADILFLPFSFEETQRGITTTSFPAKAAEYIASGTPVLICAPPYSSMAQYASQHRFAEVVNDLSEEALTRGIVSLCRHDYVLQLQDCAREVFEKNHNLNTQVSELTKALKRIAHTDESLDKQHAEAF